MGAGSSAGAGLARDAGTSVCQSHRGDAIAGKPALTQARLPQKAGSYSLIWLTAPSRSGRTRHRH
ncbi:hypothetical protein FPT15_07470 [Pseudomonas sp. RGB]|nr:hypothetical protein FPT15_07470 [Pseudomonas sp. RGB]